LDTLTVSAATLFSRHRTEASQWIAMGRNREECPRARPEASPPVAVRRSGHGVAGTA